MLHLAISHRREYGMAVALTFDRVDLGKLHESMLFFAKTRPPRWTFSSVATIRFRLRRVEMEGLEVP